VLKVDVATAQHLKRNNSSSTLQMNSTGVQMDLVWDKTLVRVRSLLNN